MEMTARISKRSYPRRPGDVREFQKMTRVYFWPKGETILDQLFTRRHRPYEEWRKLLPEVFDQLELDYTGKSRWSQRAGCTCPCSPGFVLEHKLMVDGMPIDIHVDLDYRTDEEKVADEEKAAVRAAEREARELERNAVL
jgi:hypothetical protein